MDDPNQTTPETSPPLFQPADKLPERISRYLLKAILGKGGFGVAYLAHDEQLQRLVAVKIPKPDMIMRQVDTSGSVSIIARSQCLAIDGHGQGSDWFTVPSQCCPWLPFNKVPDNHRFVETAGRGQHFAVRGEHECVNTPNVPSQPAQFPASWDQQGGLGEAFAGGDA